MMNLKVSSDVASAQAAAEIDWDEEAKWVL